MSTPMTTALLMPPGTTEVGMLLQVSDWEVDVGVTLMKDDPVPALFDL